MSAGPAREENLRALFPDTELSAEENVVNSLAAGFYREHGVRRIEPGFDAGPIPEGCRVMRTRYCLRRETGQCLRKNPAYRGRLFLASGRHVYELLFDCARCEMSVVYRGERGEPAREEGARREWKPDGPGDDRAQGLAQDDPRHGGRGRFDPDGSFQGGKSRKVGHSFASVPRSGKGPKYFMK